MGSGRIYTIEFKKQAIELAASLGSTSQAAKQLGIPDANIHVWRKKMGVGKMEAQKVLPHAPEQAEIVRLRREVHELKQANLILKTAAAFFSQDHLKKSMS